MNCRCGCATISRESETVRPVFTSARAAARRASVMRFTVPRWSSWPQRPQLFSRLKYDSTSACVGSFVPAMLASSRWMPEYATHVRGVALFARRLRRRNRVLGEAGSCDAAGTACTPRGSDRALRCPAVSTRFARGFGGCTAHAGEYHGVVKRTVRTMCPMNCHPTLCGMLVEVEDGRVTRVTGDPDNPDSRGFLCVRGQAAPEILDNPRRLLYPMLRATRGDRWRRATWDEALDLIVERMRAAGRDAVATWPGHGIFANNYGTRIHSHLLRRFSNIYGCQWWSPAIICWALGGFGLGITGLLEPNTKEDMGANANLILLWGANLASQPNTGRHLAAAKRRGAPMHKATNGRHAARASAGVPALTGQDGIAGGELGPRHGASLRGQVLGNIVALDRRPPGDDVPNQMPRITESLVSGRVRVLLLFGTDMLSSFADAHRVAEGLARQDLVVCYDLFENDTARRFADVLLPSTSWLEELGCKATNTHVYLMPQALPAPGETRSMPWVLRALAERLGLDDFFPWKDDAELVDAMIDVPATRHATVAALAAEGGMRAMNVSHVGHPDLTFPTPSGKLELFSDLAVSRGLPGLPVYEAPADSPYPLTLRQGRTLTAFHGFYDHGQALPSLAKADPEPVLWISLADATARGVGDGARITITNARGEMQARAYVTPKIPPGTVWMRDGWAGLNTLTSGDAVLPDGAVEALGFAAGQAAFDARVEVTPLG